MTISGGGTMHVSMSAPVVLGRYAVGDEIGSGGMATVHVGKALDSGHLVAIKRLHPNFAKEADFVSMFLDEARVASRVHHANVVEVFEAVMSKDELFLVMEYVEGQSLARLVKASAAAGYPPSLRIVLAVMTDMLAGLHATHEAEIVHRDVSPQNVLVGGDGRGRVLDFGIAKALGRVHATRDGQLKGKLSYMAPEQLRRGPITRRTDVYAASVVFWEALTAQRLFSGEPAEIVKSVLDGARTRPSELNANVPPAIDELVMRGLALAPDDRFDTAQQMADVFAHSPRASQSEVAAWVFGLAGDALRAQAKRASAVARFRPRWRARAVGIGGVMAVALVPLVLWARSPERRDRVAAPPSLSSVPTPVVAAAPTTVRISIASSPSAAHLWIEGTARGETPTDVTLDRGDRDVVLELRKDGFETVRRTIRPDIDQRVEWALVPRAHETTRGSRPAQPSALERWR